MHHTAVRNTILGVAVAASMAVAPAALAGPTPLLTDPAGDTTGLLGLPTTPLAPEESADLLAGDIASPGATLRFSIEVVDLPSLGDDVQTYHAFYFSHDGVGFETRAHRVWATGQTDLEFRLSDGADDMFFPGTVRYTSDTAVIELPLDEVNAFIAAQDDWPDLGPITAGSVLTNLAMSAQAEPTITAGPLTLPTTSAFGAEDVAHAPDATYTVS